MVCVFCYQSCLHYASKITTVVLSTSSFSKEKKKRLWKNFQISWNKRERESKASTLFCPSLNRAGSTCLIYIPILNELINEFFRIIFFLIEFGCVLILHIRLILIQTFKIFGVLVTLNRIFQKLSNYLDIFFFKRIILLIMMYNFPTKYAHKAFTYL